MSIPSEQSLLVLVVEVAPHHRLAELALLSGLPVFTALAARWLLRDLRVHPSNFPAPSGSAGAAPRGGAGETDARRR